MQDQPTRRVMIQNPFATPRRYFEKGETHELPTEIADEHERRGNVVPASDSPPPSPPPPPAANGNGRRRTRASEE